MKVFIVMEHGGDYMYEIVSVHSSRWYARKKIKDSKLKNHRVETWNVRK